MKTRFIAPYVAFTAAALSLTACQNPQNPMYNRADTTPYTQPSTYGALKSEDWPYNTSGSASTYTPNTDGLFGARVPNSNSVSNTTSSQQQPTSSYSSQYQQQWPYDSQRGSSGNQGGAYNTQRGSYDTQRDSSESRSQRQLSQGSNSYRHPGMTVTSSEVRQIQEALKDEGFDVGPVDGKFGSKTKQALREFQQRQGLETTGWLDEATLSALNVTVKGQR